MQHEKKKRRSKKGSNYNDKSSCDGLDSFRHATDIWQREVRQGSRTYRRASSRRIPEARKFLQGRAEERSRAGR